MSAKGSSAEVTTRVGAGRWTSTSGPPYPRHRARQIRNIRYIHDKCWQSAVSQTTFPGQIIDLTAFSSFGSVMNAPQEAMA